MSESYVNGYCPVCGERTVFEDGWCMNCGFHRGTPGHLEECSECFGEGIVFDYEKNESICPVCEGAGMVLV